MIRNGIKNSEGFFLAGNRGPSPPYDEKSIKAIFSIFSGYKIYLLRLRIVNLRSCLYLKTAATDKFWAKTNEDGHFFD
jgi:hypothetical protein